MEERILVCTKKVLGIGDDDETFDLDVITHINSAFSTLNQLGIGPLEGFAIEDDSIVWADYVDTFPILGVPQVAALGQIKTYVYLKVRMLFDPPTTSYLIGAMEKQIAEHEWRLSHAREETEWVDPDPPVVVVGDE